MFDDPGRAVLRGFDVAASDVDDRLRFCQPVLSFEGDSTLYIARKLDWRNDSKALVVADPDEADELGTLLSDTKQSIVSGEGVIVVGAGFVEEAVVAGIQLDNAEMSFSSLDGAECWISVSTSESFAKLKARLADEARTVFDKALGEAARSNHRLSERGRAALLILRRCGPRRQDDLAIRQLAGARQDREFDLHRRLLIRFARELDTQENDLYERVERHIALAAMSRRKVFGSMVDPSVTSLKELSNQYNPPFGIGMDKCRTYMDVMSRVTMEPKNTRDEMYLENKNLKNISMRSLETHFRKLISLEATPAWIISCSEVTEVLNVKKKMNFSLVSSMSLPVAHKGVVNAAEGREAV